MGKNGNIDINHNSFHCLKYQKYKIISYIAYLQKNVKIIKCTANFLLNVYIYFHSLQFPNEMEKKLLIQIYINQEINKINDISEINYKLIKRLKYFQKIAKKKSYSFHRSNFYKLNAKKRISER